MLSLPRSWTATRDKRTEVRDSAEEVSELPQLDSAAAVMKPLRDARREAAGDAPPPAAAVRRGRQELGEAR